MLYDKCIKQFERLSKLLTFQERRNFFNKSVDSDLNISIKIIDGLLNKIYEYEFSYIDLEEIFNIVIKMIENLDSSEELSSCICELKDLSNEIKKYNKETFSNFIEKKQD